MLLKKGRAYSLAGDEESLLRRSGVMGSIRDRPLATSQHIFLGRVATLVVPGES